MQNKQTGKFHFKSYNFNKDNFSASFEYGFEDGRTFKEVVGFTPGYNYDEVALDKAMKLAFLLVGTSYYKTFPSTEVDLGNLMVDQWQAEFLDHVYQEGLGQFAFENGLSRSDLAHFTPNAQSTYIQDASSYRGSGTLALQSGGKDSLLTASLLDEKGIDFTPWYVSTGSYHPVILDNVGSTLATSVRCIDRDNLIKANEDGAKNGHIPVTYVVESFALIQSILLNKNTIIVSIAHEGEEPHHFIGDLAVSHQWSKTWGAEQLLAEYVSRYISNDIKIGSPLRGYSELKVAEMFIEHAWKKYGHQFSSCNRANYKQGHENTNLSWCGECPKCANSYLLFSPFLPSDELNSIYGGKDLFADPNLTNTFKGLLGVGDIPKPFECVGEIEELRTAYHMAQTRGDYASLAFDVPKSSFNYKAMYPVQQWAFNMIK